MAVALMLALALAGPEQDASAPQPAPPMVVIDQADTVRREPPPLRQIGAEPLPPIIAYPVAQSAE